MATSKITSGSNAERTSDFVRPDDLNDLSPLHLLTSATLHRLAATPGKKAADYINLPAIEASLGAQEGAKLVIVWLDPHLAMAGATLELCRRADLLSSSHERNLRVLGNVPETMVPIGSLMFGAGEWLFHRRPDLQERDDLSALAFNGGLVGMLGYYQAN